MCDFFMNKFKKEPNAKISKLIEDLFDEIIAPDVYTDTGVGCDNMSCIVIQFKHWNKEIKRIEKNEWYLIFIF